MSVHRPLSAWVAELAVRPAGLGPINDGEERSDARQLARFTDGWQRVTVPWGDHSHVLGISLRV